jgi:hypothetical protein
MAFYLESASMGDTLTSNTADRNLAYGYLDQSTGSGTKGTANTYMGNVCKSNRVGGSNPSGLGSPQP